VDHKIASYITVTAERRSENIKDVPNSVSAIRGEALDRRSDVERVPWSLVLRRHPAWQSQESDHAGGSARRAITRAGAGHRERIAPVLPCAHAMRCTCHARRAPPGHRRQQGC